MEYSRRQEEIKMAFKETDISSLKSIPLTRSVNSGCSSTAGNGDSCNTMTASWGGVGIMWGKPVATVYIRPQRYTKEFIDKNGYFTLSFLPEEYRRSLNICGSVSGRNVEENGRKQACIRLRSTARLQWKRQKKSSCAESYMPRRCSRNVLSTESATRNGIRRRIIIQCILQRS